MKAVIQKKKKVFWIHTEDLIFDSQKAHTENIFSSMHYLVVSISVFITCLCVLNFELPF